MRPQSHDKQRQQNKSYTQPLLDNHDSLNDMLSFNELASLAQTCRLLRYRLRPELESRTLKYYAGRSQLKNVQKMLEEAQSDGHKLRDLLYKKSGDIQALPGKSSLGLTAFQAALCVGDVEMCAIFLLHFDSLANGREIMQRQIFAIFPEGFPKDEHEDPPHVVAQKAKATQFTRSLIDSCAIAICKATPDELDEILNEKQSTSPVGQCVDYFRNEVENINVKDILPNPYYLLEALYFYVVFHDDFYSVKVCNLFCVQLLGFIQRYLPLHDLQRFTQGLREPHVRTLEFRVIHQFAELHLAPRSMLKGLGFEYVVNNSGYPQQYALSLDLATELYRDYQALLTQKKISLSNFCCHVFNTKSATARAQRLATPQQIPSFYS